MSIFTYDINSMPEIFLVTSDKLLKTTTLE